MKRFRSILVGLDFTPAGTEIDAGSRRAALQAHWLAEKTGASLTLFHSTWADIYEAEHQIRGGPTAEGMQALEDLRESYDASGVSTDLVMSGERAWIEIIRRVLRGDNDLVVVARRGARGQRSLGSMSRKLMRKCPAPVWVVNLDAALLHESVLAATDLSPVGDMAVDLAASIAVTYGCKLHVAHAWRLPLDLQLSNEWRDKEEYEAKLHEIDDAAEEHILSALRASCPEAQPILHVGCDSPSHCIREGVAKLKVDLVVMGTVSRGGIAGLLIGNTAEKLLDKLECSLLTIKPADFVSPVR